MRANLLRAISHDLRTPLTGIIGAANLYLENDSQLDDQAKKNLICNIQEDADWLLNMVENLLCLSHESIPQAQKSPSHLSLSRKCFPRLYSGSRKDCRMHRST